MVGWHLLLLMVVEALIDGAIARYVYVAHGWSVASSVLLAIAIYLGVRAFLVGLEFVLGRVHGSPIPADMRVSVPRLIVMYFRELAGWLLMFTLVMPWVLARRSVTQGEPSGILEPGRQPVLLVHGLACNRANWFWFKRQMRNRGFRVYTMDCTPFISRIGRYAVQVRDAVDEVLVATGSQQLVLVGHSQGGLAIRGYLDQFGDDKVSRIVTLGTPHHGTWFASLGVGPNVVDLRERSEWLQSLSQHERARGERIYRKFTCLFTYHDNLVAPQLNAVLSGSKAIALSGIGHLSLALSPAVVDHVAREVNAAGA